MNFYAFVPKLLNMSLTASVAIIFVLLLRLMLKKAPKVISYALWAVVLFRLLCPVSIESSFSLFGLLDAPTAERTELTTSIEYVPENIVHTEYPAVTLPVPGVSDTINSTLPQGEEQLVADPLEAPVAIATWVWFAGVLGMAAYSVVSYLRLRRKLLTASPLRGNIYLADEITSPFVMGLLRPKVYLPSDMEDREQAYIIRHEQHHIRRGDHIIKALAFLALSIHWFNPLVWVAFICSNKDMEMSCDEAVVKKMGDGILADYTASLLSLATGQHIIAGMPLAFGEGDTKGRIRNLANWKRPAFWVVLAAVIACVALAVCLLTNPYHSDIVTDELQTNTYEAISIQVVNLHDYAGPGIVEVTDTELIDGLVAKLQDAEYRKPLRKIQEAPDNLAIDMALISNGRSSMRLLMLSSDHTGNEFELYVIAEDGSQFMISDPLSISGSILALIESNGMEAALGEPAQVRDLEYEIDGVYFTYDSKQYDLSERNESINAITDCFQIGNHLVLEGHTGPKHSVYCVFNTDTQAFETDMIGANLTWYGNDIHTAVYSYWSEVFTYDGRCLASYALDGSEYIYSLEYIDDGAQICARIVSDEAHERTEIIFPTTHIVAYSDVNHNHINERVIVRELHPGMNYELCVVEDGTVIWSTEASPAHTGWNTVMLYSEGGQDYLVQYQPAMYQGVGSYRCTVFSLDGGEEVIRKKWEVTFKVSVQDTPEMERFARGVGLLLRNCSVLLSTEQGIVVNGQAMAAALPQLYPVRFDPDEIQRAIDGTDFVQDLTSNAASFPDEPLDLVYASGAGGWGSLLTLLPNGSFTGDYRDSEMGSNGPEYPLGSCYVSVFEGHFTEMQQISDYAWSMTLGSLTTERAPEETWIADGVRYIAAEAAGVAGGETFLLFAPGTPADEIPAECRDWWPDAYRWRNGEIEQLEGWALCNVKVGTGFYTSWLS